MTPPETDHRVRVGRQRSARTRRRILTTAMAVFAEQGPDGAVIGDFVKAAGISRGTFYNHFQSVEELLQATSVWTTQEVIGLIEDAMEGIDGPVMRFGTGLRLFFAIAQRSVVWCQFVARVWAVGGITFPLRDIEAGLRQGCLNIPSPEAAFVLVNGGVRATLQQMGGGQTAPDFGDHVTVLLLRALGARSQHITAVMSAPLPEHRNPLAFLAREDR